MPLLASAGCDRIVTILSVKDRPQGIGRQAQSIGLQWSWLKVATANNMLLQEKMLFKQEVKKIYERVLNNESVLIHCSAGLHRTGMFAYALLRKGGCGHQKAISLIGEMRKETRLALEDKYLNLAKELY